MTAQFRLQEERHLEKTRQQQNDKRKGNAPPPPNDPVQRYQQGEYINRRSDQPQHRKNPDSPRVDERRQQRYDHGRTRRDRKDQHHPVEHAARQTFPTFPGSTVSVIVVILPAHRSIADHSFVFPIIEQQKSPQHTADMGEVGYTVHPARNAEEKFDHAIHDHEPLGFHRHRRN